MNKKLFVLVTTVAFMTNFFTIFGNHREALGFFSQGDIPQQVNQRVKDISGETEVEVNNIRQTVQELIGKITEAVKNTIEVSDFASKNTDENKTVDALTKEELENIVQKLMRARDMYKEVLDKEKMYRKALLESNRDVDRLVKKSNELINDVQKEFETTVAKLERLNSKNTKTIIDQDNIEHLKGVESILKAKTGIIEKFNHDMEGISRTSDVSKENIDRLLNQIKNGVELLNHAIDVTLLTQDLNEARQTFKTAMQINELVQKISDSLRKMADNLNVILVTANSI